MMTRAFTISLLMLLSAGCERAQQEPAETEQVQAGPTKGVDRSQAGKPAPDAEINNDQDQPSSLEEAAGKPMLVNLWASWCAPCVKELPTLDALSEKAGAPRVILVSQDVGPRASVEAFLDKHGIANPESWHDPKMRLSGALGVQVMPTTIYYDAAGREVWRYVGELDWTSEEAAALLAEAPAEAANGGASR